MPNPEQTPNKHPGKQTRIQYLEKQVQEMEKYIDELQQANNGLSNAFKAVIKMNPGITCLSAAVGSDFSDLEIQAEERERFISFRLKKVVDKP